MSIRPSFALVSLLALAACDKEASAPQTATLAPTTTAAASATTSPSGMTDEAIVATWDAGKLTYGDLKNEVGAQLIQMEIEYLTNRYQAEQQAAEQMMIEKLVEAEAAKQGKAVEELLKAEVEQKTTPPTEEEVQQMYAAMQRQLRGRPLEEVKDLVTSQALQRKSAERFQLYVDGLKTARGAKVTVPFPDLPRIEVSVDDDPSRGNAGATVTIVQFAEYQCPYCGKANETVEQVLKAYDGKVKMVFRDFPLSFHDRAIPAAIAANCAESQGKYWEIHSLMMGNQRALEEADLEGYAKAVGLDLAAWKTCRQDPAQAAEVQKDFEDGQKAGVSGTPAFFINGIMLSGALPYDMFAQIIDKELGQG